MNNRVAVSIITGDGWKEEEVKQLLTSLEPHVHGIYVSYNGTDPGYPDWWQDWTSTPIEWDYFKWNDNFADARNHALKMIPMEDYDYWMWVDTDDILVAPNGFSEMFEKMDEYTRGVFLRYAYAVEPKTGKVVVEQWRERLMATNWEWQWKFPIHEVVTSVQGTQFMRFEGPVFVQHLRLSGEDRNTRERNRRIVSKALKGDPNEPRFMYYFANEALAEASSAEPGTPEIGMLCDAAISAYQKFLEAIGSQANDDSYMAAIRIGDLFALKGDFSGALDAYLQSSKFRPDWPDSYVGCAKASMELGDWYRMKSFADIAIRMGRPVTTAAIEPMNYDFTPLFLRGLANENMGEYQQAIKDYTEAKKIWEPEGKDLTQKIKLLRKKLKEKPKENPWDMRKKYRGTRPEKSICFYTSPLAEHWNYQTLREGGHGGAETLVLELAARFAADGWRSVIFGTPGEARGIDSDTGVEFWNSDEWLPHEKFKVFISSRSPNPFAGLITADMKFLWMHDVNIGPAMLQANPPIHTRPDRIIALSHWHKEHLAHLYGIKKNRIEIVPNGYDPALYPEPTEYSDGHRLIYASSPDRGLDNLFAIWPYLRKHWPDITLDVFYGWEFIDKLIATGQTPQLQWLKTSFVDMLEQLGGEEGGIYWKGRVSPAELARESMKADYWFYPTSFCETFCITAVQQQASGVIPIASKLAALNETVGDKSLLIDGWPKNADYQGRFLAKVTEILNAHPDRRLNMRQKGRSFAEKYTMEKSYNSWNDLFKKLNG